MTRKEYNSRDLQVESRLTKVEESLEEIKTNHLPHMDAKLDRLLWFIATSSFGAAISLVYIILKLQ